MNQPLPNDDTFRAMLDRISTRHAAAVAHVEREIEQKGRRWAASEIRQLREDLARVRTDLAREQRRRE